MAGDPNERVFYTVTVQLRLYPNIQDFEITAELIKADIEEALDHLFEPDDLRVDVQEGAVF